MKGALALRKPVVSFVLNTATTSIVSTAYTTLGGPTKNAASALLIQNQGASPLTLGVGTTSSSYTSTAFIIPANTIVPEIVPIEIPSGSYLGLESAGAAVSSGYVVCTLFA